ncbi:MAG: MATE family efflux transporter [Spirochaetales bacterium]|nr:MATE family efflux transporter [Spirochaetales bacterium]
MNNSLARPNLRNLLIIAFPMIISQGAETVMLVFDRWFLSKVSMLHLSAALSGGLSSFVFSSFFMGLAGYTNAIAAQYYGAGQKNNCSLTCAQGIRLSLMLYPFMLMLIFPAKFLFVNVGHEAAQISLEFTYYSALMLGSVFSVLRSSLGGFFLGIGKTGIVMIANITGMLVNIPVNYALIFGKLGFPELGIIGAAIGTICGSFTISLILLLFYLSKQIDTEFRTRHHFRFDRIIMRKLLRFGTHAGLEMFLNVFAFNVFVLLMHSYSTTVAAAVTITFNYDLIAFIPMLGIGVATTAIVGQQLGAGRKKDAEKAAFLSIRVAWSYAAIMIILFISIPGRLADMYAGSFSPEEYEVIIPLARMMLRLAAIYILADATQLVFAGALRGAGDTKWVMRTSGILHYIMASLAVVLIKVLKIRPEQVWIMFILFVISLGISMFLRFRFGKWKKIMMIQPVPDSCDSASPV